MDDKTSGAERIFQVKEEKKSDDDSDDSQPLSSLELVRAMYESIKDVSSKTETKPEEKKRYMEIFKRERSDAFGREDLEPDRSKTDFYCKICEAHMNSEEMWESHISGKRHLKNIQKHPSEMPSKVRSIKIVAKPKLLDAIKCVNEPVVGLEFMTELQRADPYLKPSYTCHLCQANCTWSVVIDHILTTKHRLAYIKAVDPLEYDIIENLELKNKYLDELAEDQARAYEEKRGCGEIEVKLEKPKMVPPPPRMEMPYEETRIKSESSDRSRSRSCHRSWSRSRHRSRSRSRHRSRSRSRHHSRSSSRHRSRSISRHRPRSPSRHRLRSSSHHHLRSRSPSHHRSKSRPLYKRCSSRSSHRHRRYSSSSSEESSPSPRHRAVLPSIKTEKTKMKKIKMEMIEKFNVSEKIKLMQKLVQEIHPLPRSLAEEVPTIISNLTTEVLRYKIRQLPLGTQNRLAKYIAKEDTKKLYWQLMPYIEDVFDGVGLNSHH